VTIEDYLGALRRELPRGRRVRRVLVEVEDYLRAAALEHGEEEAVARFGPVHEVAAAFAPTFAAATAWRSIACALLASVLAFATFPLLENVLPPAPWPSGVPPDDLHWKQHAVLALFAVGGALTLAAAIALLARRRLLALGLVAAAALVLAAMLVLGAVLAYQWQEAVPGAPGPLAIASYSSAFALAIGSALVYAARACTLVRLPR
jgi:hypothetical protein